MAQSSPPLKNEPPLSNEISFFIGTKGLSTVDALNQLEKDGFNELPTSKPKTLQHFFLELAREPMTFLLIACGVIYLFLGDLQEALLLLGFLLIMIGIALYQEQKAERALDTLKNLSSPRALVIRDGNLIRIPGREVVRQDLIVLQEGDRVPADGFLLSGSQLLVDESLLTGEAHAVEKSTKSSSNSSRKELSSVYAGTTIIRGQGLMKVEATGPQTELGRIGKFIQTSSREPSQLETQSALLVNRFAKFSGLLCLVTVAVYGLSRGDWLNAVLSGLTLAMAILPNELPAVLTIFLALGAWRISQQRVLTRKMSAIENLGAATVLCVDKTGTLTLNQMAIKTLYTQGQTIVLSHETLTELPEDFHELIEFGILASRKTPFDPMELALWHVGNHYLRDTEHLHQNWELKKEYPLSPELLSISQAWIPQNDGHFIIAAKGAPEAIIDLCHLETPEAKRILQQVEAMGQEGLRVLGVAKAQAQTQKLPPQQHDFDFKFVGLVGLTDPIRKEVPRSLQDCKKAGIRVMMITGDHAQTAKSIAQEIGLDRPWNLLTGTELNELSDTQLQKAVKEVCIFSRVTPQQKWRLVQALKENGEIVAMTGDGVNDAPALKAAHIGIAMGVRGTDVARESASLVLLTDDFGSIVEAIRTGRRVYANLRSALVYLLAVHIPIAGLSVIPVFLKLPAVLLPIHIAFLHLIIEPVCSIVFESEPLRQDAMLKPPRNPKEPLFGRDLFIPSLIQGCSILASLLMLYLFSFYRGYQGHGEAEARTLTFTTFIISNLMLIASTRPSTHSLKVLLQPNSKNTFFWIMSGTLLTLGLTLLNPTIRALFRFSPLHGLDLALCLMIGTISVLGIHGIQAITRNPEKKTR